MPAPKPFKMIQSVVAKEKKPDRRKKENRYLSPHKVTPLYFSHYKISSPHEKKVLSLAEKHGHANRCYLCCAPLMVDICIDHSINRAVCRRCRSIKGPNNTMNYVLFLMGAPEYHRVVNDKVTIVNVNRHFRLSDAQSIWLKITK